MPPPAVEHLELVANGLRFHAAAAGPRDGPLVLLLHGFPEGWFGWRQQIGALAKAGLRVVAPDQRGYGASDKPVGRTAYTLDRLALDVVGLVAACGRERCAVVGHDWGGVVAWRLASHHADRVERIAVLDAPHPAVMRGHVLRHPTQLAMSSYIGFFQLPLLPEAMLSANRHAALAQALRNSARPGVFDEPTLAIYRDAWSIPGAMTAMLNWYRALPFGPSPSAGRVRVPVRILWGDGDTALQPGLAEASARQCDGPVSILHVASATHWLQHEEPERVNAALLAFLRG